jgi:hypothetical protein
VGHVAATRSPQEVFNHHVQALGAEDLDEIVADFSDDAIFITPAGVLRGKDSIRQAWVPVGWLGSTRTSRCSPVPRQVRPGQVAGVVPDHGAGQGGGDHARWSLGW